MIGVIDYGAGNFTSVYNALSVLSDELKPIDSPDAFEGATHVVLPGVGAYGAAMSLISDLGLVGPLEEHVLRRKVPFLGICVGMQVLSSVGHEYGEHEGLGWIPSVVRPLENDLLPHMGWNEVTATNSIPIFRGIEDQSTFYFVHSNAMHLDEGDSETSLATCDYDEEFTCAVQRDNVFGVQFHPEKSQDVGLKLLKNFIGL
jgi:glutamine amidotransferase